MEILFKKRYIKVKFISYEDGLYIVEFEYKGVKLTIDTIDDFLETLNDN